MWKGHSHVEGALACGRGTRMWKGHSHVEGALMCGGAHMCGWGTLMYVSLVLECTVNYCLECTVNYCLECTVNYCLECDSQLLSIQKFGSMLLSAIMKNHKIGSGTVCGGPRVYCQLLTVSQVWVKLSNIVDGNRKFHISHYEKSQNWAWHGPWWS